MDKNKTNNENKQIEYYKGDSKCSDNNDQILRKYIHDIRNIKIFTREILENINKLSYEDRLDILITYNDMFEYFQYFLSSEN
jgi:hypothetical protein